MSLEGSKLSINGLTLNVLVGISTTSGAAALSSPVSFPSTCSATRDWEGPSGHSAVVTSSNLAAVPAWRLRDVSLELQVVLR